MKNLLFYITLCSLILSCSKDEGVQNYDVPDIRTQKVYSEFDISNAPNGRFDIGWTDGSKSIYPDNGVINYIAYGYQLTYVPSANFRYHHLLSFYPDTNTNGDYLLGCANIIINTFHNDSLIDSENYQFGYEQTNPSLILCQDGLSKRKDFLLESN